jgi:hypothetical protein
MITDTQTQLLTASVDGELSPRQRKAVERLLRHSAEARQLLQQLKDDAVQLRSLPRCYPERGFTERVIRAATWQARAVRQPARPAQRNIPAWVGLAAAAAVLLAVTGGSYFYFNSRPAQTDPAIAIHKDQPAPNNGVQNEKELDGNGAQAKRENAVSQPQEKTPEPIDNAIAKKEVVGPEKPEETPTESALTAPIEKMELFQPKIADVKLSLILKMHELDADKLRTEVKKDKAFRLELPCTDTAKAFTRIEAAFKTQGVNLVIDQIAHNRLKQAKAKTNYVFYADDLTPEELANLIQHLSGEDTKAEAQRQGDGLFEGLVVNRMSDADHKELKELLGVDPRPTAKPAPADPKKPLSETTADQVAQNIAAGAGKPAAKGTDHLALALAYNPERPRPNSAEVKRFLESRKTRRAGTLQILLVVRGI